MVNFTDVIMGDPTLARLVHEVFAPRDPHTHELISFDLKPGQHKYLYYKGKGGAQHCYTPHKDTRGWYWCWTYQPKGKGSQSGNPKKWKMTKLVRFRKRKDAMARAEKRSRV